MRLALFVSLLVSFASVLPLPAQPAAPVEVVSHEMIADVLGSSIAAGRSRSGNTTSS